MGAAQPGRFTPEPRVAAVSALDLRVTAGGWAFAAENRAAIDRHWAGLVAKNPRLWNGRPLICTRAEVEQGCLRAEFAETDYASFVTWRDWGRPDRSVVNCFGVPAVFSACGALVVGVMSGATLNAGKAYPPSGALEAHDVGPDGRVDIIGNMLTEFREETGIDLAIARPGPMVAIFEGPRVALARRYDLDMSFDEIARRFAAHAAADPHAELAAVEPLRHAADVDSRHIPYVAALIGHFQA